MPRTTSTIKKSHPALRSAPIPGAGVVRRTKNSMSNNTTIFRLLKVPKYAKRTLATMCERKSQELEEEVSRLKQDWMDQEKEIEWLRRELVRVQGELSAAKDGGYEGTMLGQGQGQSGDLTEKEKEELAALWDC